MGKHQLPHATYLCHQFPIKSRAAEQADQSGELVNVQADKTRDTPRVLVGLYLLGSKGSFDGRESHLAMLGAVLVGGHNVCNAGPYLCILVDRTPIDLFAKLWVVVWKLDSNGVD